MHTAPYSTHSRKQATSSCLLKAQLITTSASNTRLKMNRAMGRFVLISAIQAFKKLFKMAPCL